ncbi:G-protein coupled receptor Mth isoform X1 [Musca domestica]|uniref:G-protein coupled receptor Mth isoform X1 n=1 Tax=Musca domestica TaxID=7370 RepID=A0ABM3V955_MUSDO|nr:G-protein coupled receptor Mth isoform X1 [Musca domestica]
MKILLPAALLMTIFGWQLVVVASNDVCHTDETSCIKSCCNSTDFYRINPEKCHLVWKYFNLSMDSKLNVFNGNHRYMELLVKFWHDVSVPCLRSEDIQISWPRKEWSWIENPNHIPDYCFTQHYNDTTHKTDFIPLDCATEYTWYSYSRYVIIVGLILSVLLLLSTICIYLLIKDLRGNMRLKLFIWYLTSLVMAHTSMITCVDVIWSYGNQKYLSVVIGFISSYFFMSTFLSMNVIGFEIWITFKQLSVENNLRNDQKRYTLYAIYVWSIPIIFYILYFLTLSSFWSFGPVVIILFLNFFTFVILTYKICTTRYNVANLTDNQNLVVETVKIILSLFFMMGIPRLIFFVFLYMSNLAYYMISKYIFLSIEAPLIFKLFVLKKNVWNMLKNRFWHKYIQANTTTEDVSATP